MIVGLSNRVLPVNSGVFSITPGRYCKEVENIIEIAKYKGYRLPTDYQLRMLNFYINEQKLNGIWVKRDFVYMFGYNSLFTRYGKHENTSAGELNLLDSFTLIDLKKPTRSATLVQTDQSPFFNEIGVKNNSSIVADGYIDTNYYPTTDAINWTQDNASFCVYVSNRGTQVGGGGEQIIGLRDSGVTRRICSLNIRTATDTTTGNLNRSNDGGEATFVAAGVSEVAGFHSLDRTASNLTTYYKNGASAGTSAQASGTFNSSTLSIWLLAGNPGGNEWRRSGLSIACGGGSLGATLQKIDYDIFTQFRTKLGYQ